MTSSSPRVLTPDSLLTLPEAAMALRITTRHLLTLRKQGRIRTVHLGTRVLVPHREIIRIVDEALADRRSVRLCCRSGPAPALCP